MEQKLQRLSLRVFVLDHVKVKDLIPEEVIPFLPAPEMANMSFRELLSAAGTSLFTVGGMLRNEWSKPEKVPMIVENIAGCGGEVFGLMRMIMWILGEADMAIMASKECHEAGMRVQGQPLILAVH